MNSQIKTNIFSLTLLGFFQGSFHPFFFFPDFLLLPASAVPAVNSEETSFRTWLHGHISLMQSWLVKFPLPCLPPCSHSLSPALYLFLQLQDELIKVKTKAEEPIKVQNHFSHRHQPFPQNPQRITEGWKKQYKNRKSSSQTSLEYCPSFQHFVAQGFPEPVEVSAVFAFGSVPSSTEVVFHGEQNQKSVTATQRWHWKGIIATRRK